MTRINDKFVLVLTNSEDATADYLINKLGNSIHFLRINSDTDLKNIEIIVNHQSTIVSYCNTKLSISDIIAVWYRRPKEFNLSIEVEEGEKKHAIGEWREALEGVLYRINDSKWINHPIFIKKASYKLEQLERATCFGLQIPNYIVTSRKKELINFKEKYNHIIVKPISHGYLEREIPEKDTLIYCNEVSTKDVDDFPVNNYCPTLFQEYISRGCDLRIVILDEMVCAIELISKEKNKVIDIRIDNMDGVNYKIHTLPKKIENCILDLVKSYSLRFATIDMIIDEKGNYIFLEVNPNGQWAWTDIYEVTEIYSMFQKAFTQVYHV